MEIFHRICWTDIRIREVSASVWHPNLSSWILWLSTSWIMWLSTSWIMWILCGCGIKKNYTTLHSTNAKHITATPNDYVARWILFSDVLLLRGLVVKITWFGNHEDQGKMTADSGFENQYRCRWSDLGVCYVQDHFHEHFNGDLERHHSEK